MAKQHANNERTIVMLHSLANNHNSEDTLVCHHAQLVEIHVRNSRDETVQLSVTAVAYRLRASSFNYCCQTKQNKTKHTEGQTKNEYKNKTKKVPVREKHNTHIIYVQYTHTK